MKIYWLSAFVGAIVLLSFQNCQKSPYKDEINSLSKNASAASSSDSSTSGAVTQVNLSEQHVDQVQFISKGPQTVTNNGKTYSLVVNKVESVDLATGKISVTSDGSAAVDNYCLTDDLKNELLNIVKSSSVCKSNKQVAAGQACTQALVTPYAVVITSNDQFNLGSANDGCGTNSIDLCDDQPSLLKGYIANLNAKLSTLVCN